MLATIAAVLASVATIVGGGIWLFKWIANRAETTAVQRDTDTDKRVASERDTVKAGGRPKWD